MICERVSRLTAYFKRFQKFKFLTNDLGLLYLCEEWSKLGQIQQIQFMEGLWNQIREEDMWLDYDQMKLNESQIAQDIYWYSYDESDHKKMSTQSKDTGGINKDLRNSDTGKSSNNIDESVW